MSLTEDKKKNTYICPFPFSRIELGHRHNEFIPCCGAWLKDEYYSDKKKDNYFDGKDISQDEIPENDKYEVTWNSEQAKKLRKSILDGSYKYCNLSRCNKPEMSITEIEKMDPNYFETPISDNNINRILDGNPEMMDGPSSISLAADNKCNLKCPTCRPDYRVKSDEFENYVIKKEFSFIDTYKENLKVLKFANNGEVFFSKDQSKLLKSINQEDYPNLDHLFVITNGLLFNQDTMDQLKPGSDFIKKIAISLDAGNEKTYKVTRGGNWNTLQENLKWISYKRKKGEFLWLNYNFVVRKANYKSIDEFVTLARSLSVDRIEFIKYDNWFDLYDKNLVLNIDYDSEAIHLRNHPLNGDLKAIFQKYKDDPDVLINIDGIFD
jgi:wyosine [tRNA(Phe)-imidazoG37] synthetase (radical SAM superfamily)